jgi:hypothetical protein
MKVKRIYIKKRILYATKEEVIFDFLKVAIKEYYPYDFPLVKIKTERKQMTNLRDLQKNTPLSFDIFSTKLSK